MKTFISLIKKEKDHILRDTRTLIILIGMPITLIMLFGYAITNEINSAKIGILDFAKDNSSKVLTSKLLSSDYFIEGAKLKVYDDIEEQFKADNIMVAIVIPNDFEKSILNGSNPKVQIISDGTDPNTATTLINYINNIIQKANLSEIKYENINLPISTEHRMLFNEELKGVHLFVPGLITILLMLISSMMTSLSIAREKETGTLELMLVSPLKPAAFITAKMIPYIFLSIMNAAIIIILGKFVFEVPLRGELWLIGFESIIFISSALALGVLISTISSSQQTALLLSLVGLMLPTILLSGFIFPLENMPLPLQIISKLIPATWFMEIIRGVMLKGMTLNQLIKPTLILILMTVVFSLISIKKFKLRLE